MVNTESSVKKKAYDKYKQRNNETTIILDGGLQYWRMITKTSIKRNKTEFMIKIQYNLVKMWKQIVK
jgi:hypothetical protein